uniref:NAD-dependent histone deacetylase SIR2 n=1 Tax=Ganoderma boninense TaxID=34458 RepID=A0A5K1K9D1_9APHY|nr:NAD-dependent histone deacetylase SIR2 [Ganoderma boninense]
MSEVTVSLSGLASGHNSVSPPDAYRPLCLSAACRTDVAMSNGSVVDRSASQVGGSLDVSAGSQVPDTPRLTPFLDFDDGEDPDVNGSDFDGFDFEDPGYQTASWSTLEASNCWSGYYIDADAIGMSMSSSMITALPPPSPMVNRTVPPQFGPTIPE